MEFEIIDSVKTAGVWTIYDHANKEPVSDHETYDEAEQALSDAYASRAKQISRGVY